MLEQAYHVVAEDFGLLLGRLWLEKINDKLWEFTQSLDQWLYQLFQHPTPSWREQFDAFLEEQATAGFTVTPEGQAEIIAFLEAWARGIPEPAPPKPSSRPTVELLAYHPAANSRGGRQVPPSQTYQQPPKPPQYGPIVRTDWHFFHDKLKQADRYLDDLQRLLDQLGNKVVAANSEETVEVETDADEAASLIWLHNDAMESARQAWLDGNLGSEPYERLVLARSPASFWLPLFTDPAQAKRAQAQWKEIGQRLKKKIAFLDNVIFAMQVIEQAGNIAGIAIGPALVLQAAKQAGKICIKKVVQKVASATVKSVVAAGITKAANEAIEEALLAAGVSEETISTIQTGATVVVWALGLRKFGKSLNSNREIAKDTPKLPQGSTAIPSARTVPKNGPYKNPSGDPEIAAKKARAQPYGARPVEPPRRKSHPPVEGRLDSPRTPEHSFLQRTIAQEMQATGDYTRIAMRTKLSKISGVKHDPDIEPDNLGVHMDGRIDIIEILSPSQRRSVLEAKLLHALNELPPNLRGGIRVIDPKDAFK